MALVVDTGPILAAFNRRDDHYEHCRGLLDTFPETLLVPGPVLVEVDYFVRTRLYPALFLDLLSDIRSGLMQIIELEATDFTRVEELCRQYADSDVGFVDAAVLAIVERLNEPKLATLDRRHFAMMRLRQIEALTLLP